MKAALAAILLLSSVPVNGRVFDSKEVKELVKASLEFWLTDGDYSEKFSKKMSKNE